MRVSVLGLTTGDVAIMIAPVFDVRRRRGHWPAARADMVFLDAGIDLRGA